jgi:arsenate reductase
MTQKTPVVIYHNPRCSKSRAALALLRERGIEPTVIEYLRTPPDERTLVDLLDRLGLPASAILRRKEEAFRLAHADRALSDQELIAVLVAHPELLERPIVRCGSRAVIARPPERVLEIL